LCRLPIETSGDGWKDIFSVYPYQFAKFQRFCVVSDPTFDAGVSIVCFQLASKRTEVYPPDFGEFSRAVAG